LLLAILIGYPRLASAADQDPLLPRDPARTIDLSSFQGDTYLQLALLNGNGIVDKTNVDDNTAVKIGSAVSIIQTINKFDPRISQRLYAQFKNGQTDFQSLVTPFEGRSVTPQNIGSIIGPNIKNIQNPNSANIARALSSTSVLVLLSSGSGTIVRLNEGDYFYNVGYQTPNVRSGRTFSITQGRPLLDPSDNDYLSEMDAYLSAAPPNELARFYGALFHVLTKCDASDIPALTSAGQTVATDFFAIYTAELNRHVMANLVPDKSPWEIDIGEVTLLTSYGAASHMVMKGGKLIKGTATAYFASGSTGSGIGDTRKDFVKLAKAITSFEESAGHHPELVEKIVTLTPIQDPTINADVNGDVFRRLLIYLNRREFQQDVQNHSDDLASAVTALVVQSRADQEQITDYVSTN